MHLYRPLIFFITVLLMLLSASTLGQQRKDTLRKTVDTSKLASKKNMADTGSVKKKRTEAGKASIRSAVIPGWGQIYNKKYWKLPIVYGVLAIPVVTFSYNKKWYDKTREAYSIRYYNDTSKVSDLPTDSIDPTLQPLSTASLRLYRNEFRQNVDFSVLAFLVIWGLQVADAAVDAHLKSFNVSDDLSLKIKPMFAPGRSTGVSFVLSLRDDKPKATFVGF